MVNGIIDGKEMRVRIDKAGRIIVPKRLRERLGVTREGQLEVIERPDGVLLKGTEQRPSMINKDGLWVHEGVPEAGARWDRLVDEIREERIDSITLT